MPAGPDAVAGGVEPDSPADLVTGAARGSHTYTQILKSSAIVGGSSIVGIGVSIARAKAMALLLGPAGVGLLGLFMSIHELTHSLAGMGINSSGVRQIAAAAGTGEVDRIAVTAAVLRRTSMVLGLLGAVLLVVFRRSVSEWTFGSDRYATPVAFLALCVWLRSVSDGQAALIQGMRRIADLARINIFSAVFGAIASVGLVYLLGENGVVPSLVAVATLTVGISWWYRRKVDVPSTSVTLAQARVETGGLLALGFAFMASAVLSTGAAYAIRVIVRDSAGMGAAGLYQSAWALGGLYVGFILQAMGSDFYPRLTAAANNHRECNRLVNEQAQIGLLLAGPGVIATLAFAPVVIGVFYASTFGAAVEPLRWICLGMTLRVVAWPMGYIILAKGARNLFFWTEVAAAAVHVGLALVLVRFFGLAGATMAFFALYVVHGLVVYAIVRQLTGFRWSADNVRIASVFLPLIAFVFVWCFFVPVWLATLVGLAAASSSSVYSLRIVCRLVPLDRIPPVARHVLTWFRITPPVMAPLAGGADS